MFVRVALDTCVVRNHTDDQEPKLDLDLIRKWRDSVRVSLSASAFAELFRQLLDGDLSYKAWREKAPSLNSILDQRWPCLPNGKQLAWLAGMQTSDPIDSIEDESRYMRAVWHYLLTVAPDEIGKSQVVYRVSDGTLRSIRTEGSQLRNAIEKERLQWVDYILKMQTDLPKQGIKTSDEKAIAALMRSNLGSDPRDPPGLAEKLDAPSRMISRFVARALPSQRGEYNPQSEKRRGDAFDLNLLFYVPLPAVIVTGDGRFVRGLRETKAQHAKQVLLIEEFHEALRSGTLASLVDEFQSPEKQLRQHREAAYLRWEKRSRPHSDDWEDWFKSEPIA